MQKCFFISGALLFLSLSIGAMEPDPKLLPLTRLEAQIAAYEQDPQVASIAHYFINPHYEIKFLPKLDNHIHATLMVNALLVALKHNEYPVDTLQVANITLPTPKRLIRLAIYALDDTCRAWHQNYKPNPHDDSPAIPLEQIEKNYTFAVNRIEKAICIYRATHVAKIIQSYLRALTKNK